VSRDFTKVQLFRRDEEVKDWTVIRHFVTSDTISYCV